MFALVPGEIRISTGFHAEFFGTEVVHRHFHQHSERLARRINRSVLGNQAFHLRDQFQNLIVILVDWSESKFHSFVGACALHISSSTQSSETRASIAYDHSVGSGITEAKAVRARYGRRAARQSNDPALPLFLEERARAVARLLTETGIDRSRARVLEIGCGTGGNLLDLIRFGFVPWNLAGVDLLEDRLEEARRRLPADVQLIAGDALDLKFESGTLDVVILFTVFTSLLDRDYRQRLARHAWRLVKPGGGILWYDFCFDNPGNRDVKGVPVKTIRALFPDGIVHSRRITLAPPLARAAVRVHPSLYGVLNAIPVLRTHALCWIAKEGD